MEVCMGFLHNLFASFREYCCTLSAGFLPWWGHSLVHRLLVHWHYVFDRHNSDIFYCCDRLKNSNPYHQSEENRHHLLEVMVFYWLGVYSSSWFAWRTARRKFSTSLCQNWKALQTDQTFPPSQAIQTFQRQQRSFFSSIIFHATQLWYATYHLHCNLCSLFLPHLRLHVRFLVWVRWRNRRFLAL